MGVVHSLSLPPSGEVPSAARQRGHKVFSNPLSHFRPFGCILCAGGNPAGKEAVNTESTLQRTGRSLQDIYTAQVDRVYRLARLYMKNHHDSEDVVQDVFVRLIREVQKGKQFESPEHEKAWLIVTTANVCKNKLREKSRTELPLEDYDQLPAMDREHFYIYDALLRLPENYKSAVYLFYYEGYRTDEIAELLHERPATIRTWLSRARKQLRKELGGDFLA